MEFQICPRVKYARPEGGLFRAEKWKVFTVGDGDLFFRAMKIFCPELVLERADYKAANVRLSVSENYSSRNEYCSLRILENALEIHCRDSAGARNAAAILAQLLEEADGFWQLPCGVVEDWPDAQYRAFMVESSGRVWTPMETILEDIRLMALSRMNVLQFHFMEDPGCTVPLESSPNLAGGPKGEKFTRQEIDGMIAYAADLGIRVTPFIEVLSHAADFARKEGLVCPGDSDENLYDVCLGQEKTYAAIEKVIREVAEIFPDDTIHIGADEYDMSRVTPYTAHWDQCPHCRALSEKLGYTTLRQLFLYGIQRINAIVNSAGKVMMMWNADLHPGHLPEALDRNILIHYYRYCSDLGKENIYNLHINGYGDEGFSVVNSYYPQTYMDLPEYMSTEKLNSWTYLHDPLVSRRNRAKVTGGCLCAWEEFKHYRRTVPAAIILFADRLWNALGDPVPYDDAYGQAMTRLLFEKQLPAGMNVFACIGDVMPPLRDDSPADVLRISADKNEMQTVRDSLTALEGNTAKAYAEAVAWALEEKEKQNAPVLPQKERLAFKG